VQQNSERGRRSEKGRRLNRVCPVHINTLGFRRRMQNDRG
jgi:hypothetical protein